ncbi:MAG: 3-oxoacyl-ACP reductase FabG [Sutterella sp.]|nr:3-oxoacyl-ACP reductase FabG [Sutterella sp.]MDY3273987.1 3-oxoacyl-ACP reductase FabG [Duodenibacillus sp.]
MGALFSTDAFAGRVVLVTGASRGIGKSIAEIFNEAGARVIGTATTEGGAQKITEALAGSGKGVIFDVTDATAADALIQSIVKDEGKIDILVNNAGITRDTLSMRMTDENWNAVLEADLTGAFRLVRAALRPMMRARYGRIVNLASVVGVTGNAGQANYAAAKAGLIAMSRSVAREVAARSITVNCVAPGFIETDMTKTIPEAMRETLLKEIPAQRFGKPEDIAQAVLFLASDAASYITGAVLHTNGGLYTGY